MAEKESRIKKGKKGIEKYIAIFLILLYWIFLSKLKDIICSELSDSQLLVLFGSCFGISLLFFELYRNMTLSKTKSLYKGRAKDIISFLLLSTKIFLIFALIFTSFSVSLFLFYIFTLISSSVISIVFLLFYVVIMTFLTILILVLVF